MQGVVAVAGGVGAVHRVGAGGRGAVAVVADLGGGGQRVGGLLQVPGPVVGVGGLVVLRVGGGAGLVLRGRVGPGVGVAVGRLAGGTGRGLAGGHRLAAVGPVGAGGGRVLPVGVAGHVVQGGVAGRPGVVLLVDGLGHQVLGVERVGGVRHRGDRAGLAGVRVGDLGFGGGDVGQPGGGGGAGAAVDLADRGDPVAGVIADLGGDVRAVLDRGHVVGGVVAELDQRPVGLLHRGQVTVAVLGVGHGPGAQGCRRTGSGCPDTRWGTQRSPSHWGWRRPWGCR